LPPNCNEAKVAKPFQSGELALVAQQVEPSDRTDASSLFFPLALAAWRKPYLVVRPGRALFGHDLRSNDMDKPSLVERLGYGPESRLLIVNCDDLGSSHSANVATFRSIVYGVATSATLMVPCPWAREAARMFKGFAVGVHLTLTSEYPGYRWRGLTNGASLHDHESFFPTTTEEALQRIDAKDARAECRAQIETAISWGVDISVPQQAA
jgi:hypothetical protein